MESPIAAIGRTLKEIRTARALTLEDAARLTGVSKPMLGQIERGQSIPTITTLWKIATGLKVPFSVFLQAQTPDYTVAVPQSKNPITEDNGHMRAYPLFTYDPLRNLEMFYIEFDKGCHHTSAPHTDGVEEYVCMIQGKLQLLLNGQEVVIEEKQALRFRADIPHSYNNPFSDTAMVYNTIFYPHH